METKAEQSFQFTASPVYGKQERKGGHGLFTARKLLHLDKAFTGRHHIVLDSTEIRLLPPLDGSLRIPYHCVFKTQKPDSASWKRLALCQILVNLIDAAGHVPICLVEQITSIS